MTFLRRLLTFSVRVPVERCKKYGWQMRIVDVCLIGQKVSGEYLRLQGWVPWWLGLAYHDYQFDRWMAYPKPFHLVARFLRYEYYLFLQEYWQFEFWRLGPEIDRRFENQRMSFQMWVETRGL